MKKSPMPRSTKPPARKTRIRPVNRARKARLFKEDFDSPEFVAWIRSLPCAWCLAQGRSVAAHTRSRGAGGKASDVIPLCHNCHRLYDEHVFTLPHRDSLRALAHVYWSRWLAAAPPSTGAE